MQQSIKAAVLASFPELQGGLHLDHYARVVKVADSPEKGSSSERFRPRYAVDIEILTPDHEPDPKFPKYAAVPLPVPVGAGGESGSFAFPAPGTLLVVGFAYGRQDHPIIRQIYPMGENLPKVAQGEVLLQQTPAVFQRADAAGNWQRETDAAIQEKSLSRTVSAVESVKNLGSEAKTVLEHSKTEVGGKYEVEAGGFLSMLAGQRADVGTLGNLNLSAGGESTHSTAKKATETVGGDHVSRVMQNREITVDGGREEKVAKDQSTDIKGKNTLDVGKSMALKVGTTLTETVGGSSKENVGGNKNIDAANITLHAKGKMKCWSGENEESGISLYRELLWALDDIKAALDYIKNALDVLATHNHPDAGTINQGAAVQSNANSSHAHATDMHRHRNIMYDITD